MPNNAFQERSVHASADPLPRLRQPLVAFIRSKVRDTSLAEDLAHESLLRVQSRLMTLRSRDRLEAWVFQIARNTISDHFRRSRETEEFDEVAHGALIRAAEHEPAAEEEALSADLQSYVRSLVDRLPPNYRDAIRHIELEGLSQVELARRLGISVSAAKSRVQRGRAMLRKEMERCCHWETDHYGTVLAVEPRGPCSCRDSTSTGCEK